MFKIGKIGLRFGALILLFNLLVACSHTTSSLNEKPGPSLVSPFESNFFFQPANPTGLKATGIDNR